MQSKRRLILFVTAFTIVFGFLTIADPLFAASTEQVLYSFCTLSNCTDGATPSASPIFDAAGNLYGTTLYGGAYGCGTVFQLAPAANGTWTEAVLYSFCSGGTDGAYPYASLIFDAAGNLYGTTEWGGAYGCGTVFRLAPAANGTWTEAVLYSFGNGTDGQNPLAGLIFDAAGNLFGTTYGGGAYRVGTVFELAPGTNGKWTEKVLHSFGKDGFSPVASLIFDPAGHLYGTTSDGGFYGWGTVFQLTSGARGKWTEKVLHSFGNGNDGHEPYAGLTLDAAGNLYGTTWAGGSGSCYYGGCGTVFRLSPGKKGKWKEQVLHRFSANGTDGFQPYAGLILDAAGDLYGTTYLGGAYEDLGTAFRLALGTNGKWTEKVLHSFGRGTDGDGPWGSLIFDAAGNLYGTTQGGGAYGRGTVFEVTP